MRRISQRTYHIGKIFTLVQRTHLHGREAHFLHHHGDGTFLDVGICNGQRHTLSMLTHPDNDEIASLSAAGNEGGFNLKEKYFL